MEESKNEPSAISKNKPVGKHGKKIALCSAFVVLITVIGFLLGIILINKDRVKSDADLGLIREYSRMFGPFFSAFGIKDPDNDRPVYVDTVLGYGVLDDGRFYIDCRTVTINREKNAFEKFKDIRVSFTRDHDSYGFEYSDY